MIINHSITSLNASNYLYKTAGRLEKSLERLSSGFRINSAADDAAGLAISEKMRNQIKGLAQSSGSAQDAKRLLKIADSALAIIHDMLGRLESLAVQATSDINTDLDRSHLQDEYTQIIAWINHIADSTRYNTRKILSGEVAVAATTTDTTLRIDSVPSTATVSSVNLRINAAADRANVAAARTAGPLAAATAAQAGTLYVNGQAITVSAGETAATLVAKINAISDKTKVVAGNTATNVVNFASGYLDSGGVTAARRYEGSNYTVDLSSDNANLMAWLNLEVYNYSAGAWQAGTFATGKDLTAGNVTIGGVAAQVVGSKAIAADASGAAGLVIQTDVGATMNLTAAFASPPAATGGQTGVGTDILINISTARQLKIQVGASADENLRIGIHNVSSTGLGVAAEGASANNIAETRITSWTAANDALKVIQKAVEDVSKQRSAVGAMMNRLDYVIANLNSQHENMQAAESRIRDADMAAEMTEFTREQILLQAGTAMLAQSNVKNFNILTLLY